MWKLIVEDTMWWDNDNTFHGKTDSYELMFNSPFAGKENVASFRSRKGQALLTNCYIKNTVRWLEFSFSGQCTEKQIHEKLLNSLNGNVLKHRNSFIGYVDSHQELYWIFNPYYEAAYEYAGVIELRDKLREYLTNENFGDYVLKYIQSYDEQENPYIKLNQEFKFRVKAMQEYIAKNKRQYYHW